MSEGEAAAIQAILIGLEKAWRAGDAEAYSRQVSEDCVFTNIFGQTFVGRAGFEKQHAKIFATIYRDTLLKLTLEHLRFLTPDIAAADVKTEVRSSNGSPVGPMRAEALYTKLNQILVRKGTHWEIASYHNVDVKTPPV